MKVLSKFYGIVVGMFVTRPYVAHFHAIYGDSELVVGIGPVRVLQGDAPGRVRSMVLEWAGQHEAELLEAWDGLGQARQVAPIEPLQ